MIEVDSSGLNENIRRTYRLFDNIETQIVAMAYYFQTVIKARTPKKTGGTSKSWDVHVSMGGDKIVWEISPDGKEKEVEWLEFGTPDHVILPHGEALRFEKGGEVVFAKRVYHPGTKPLGFVRVTQDDLDKSAKELGEKLLRDISIVWS